MRLLLTGAFLCVLLAPTNHSQAAPEPEPVSYGHAHPDHVQNLLDYRLPDWSYRTWDADFYLNGRGQHLDRAVGNTDQTAMTTQLATTFFQEWESETTQRFLRAGLAGYHNHTHLGTPGGVSSSTHLEGDYDLEGGLARYLGDRPFFISAGLDLRGTYDQRSQENSSQEEQGPDDIIRTSSRELSLGVGWGRLRNVEPLIRAERLNERLQALGKPALDDEEVRRVARALAREGGYVQVFERPDRHFWDAVLAPVVAGGRTLSPYEMYYLADALTEDIGTRRQGWALTAGYTYGETRWAESPGGKVLTRSRLPELELSWSHNLSLEHQLSAGAGWLYRWSELNTKIEDSHLDLDVAHLWLLTDRHRLESEVRLNLYASHEKPAYTTRNRLAGLSCLFHSRLEDRLSMVAGIEGTYVWNRETDGAERTSWNWQYRLGLTVHLDRTLL